MAQRAAQTERVISVNQVTELMKLLRGAGSAELKATVAAADRYSVYRNLGMDPLDAQMRQVAFFDTPDLALNRVGVVVRARRVQKKPGDSVVKLRPIVPDEIPAAVRMSPGFGIEVDAMPGGYVCSGSMKSPPLDDGAVKAVMLGQAPVSTLFDLEQQALFAANAPDGLALDDLSLLGPIPVIKLRFRPADFERRLVAELWFYPDGARVLELSTKCDPADAFIVAAETRAFLESHGVDLDAPQQTKTKTAMEYFAAQLKPAKKSPAKKSPAKKSPAKKASATKASATKSPAKKASAKKPSAKKASAKK